MQNNPWEDALEDITHKALKKAGFEDKVDIVVAPKPKFGDNKEIAAELLKLKL